MMFYYNKGIYMDCPIPLYFGVLIYIYIYIYLARDARAMKRRLEETRIVALPGMWSATYFPILWNHL